jgi:hypothetical protein
MVRRIIIYSPAFPPKVDGVSTRLKNHLSKLYLATSSQSLGAPSESLDILVLAPDMVGDLPVSKSVGRDDSAILQQFIPDMNSKSAVKGCKIRVLRIPSFQPSVRLAPESRLANPLWFLGLIRVLDQFQPHVCHWIGPDFFWLTLWLALMWFRFRSWILSFMTKRTPTIIQPRIVVSYQ